jgi:metal-responsive CopG/Arc/MetJ family transcriptional regulator
MRTLIDIPENQLAELALICANRQQSRAEVVRQAIGAYIAQQTRPEAAQAFGSWGAGEDGVAYQQRLRSEWQ